METIKTFEITTSMRKIIVKARNDEEARQIVIGQLDETETIIMITTKSDARLSLKIINV